MASDSHEAQVQKIRKSLHSPVNASEAKTGSKAPLALPPPPAYSKTPPAFLHKLYNMVDDPSTNTYIKWSESGRTFLINHLDDFAHFILPRFFKTNNFASFVRQLNMYGFHKVPHISTGALKPDTDAEKWEFTNPNFLRDQRDLLSMITRKKGTSGLNDEEGMDLQNVMAEIDTIKRHQTSISADLRSIREDNNMIWQESQISRQRHQKHQDTIEKILRFLASVYGNKGRLSPSEQGNGTPPSIVRKRPLLLEDVPVPEPDDSDLFGPMSKRFKDQVSEGRQSYAGGDGNLGIDDDLFDFNEYQNPELETWLPDGGQLVDDSTQTGAGLVDKRLIPAVPQRPTMLGNTKRQPSLDDLANDLSSQEHSIAQLASWLNIDPSATGPYPNLDFPLGDVLGKGEQVNDQSDMHT